jgi:hypothetical protein
VNGLAQFFGNLVENPPLKVHRKFVPDPFELRARKWGQEIFKAQVFENFDQKKFFEKMNKNQIMAPKFLVVDGVTSRKWLILRSFLILLVRFR